MGLSYSSPEFEDSTDIYFVFSWDYHLCCDIYSMSLVNSIIDVFTEVNSYAHLF